MHWRRGAELEYFETFDQDDRPLGLVRRDLVHARGDLHRAVQVWLFDRDGALLMQQRAVHKDLFGGCWDSSVGEHLTPGETYLEAAHRGLAEELGVRGVPLRAIGGVERMRLVGPGYDDFEAQQLFSGVYDGPLEPAVAEVQAVRWCSLDAVRRELERAPERFAPWFQRHLARYLENSSS